MENAERKLAALKPQVTSPDLDVAKDTRVVVSDRVRLLHAHEAKVASLESKNEKATEAIVKHKAAKIEARQVEEERHRKRMAAIEDDFTRMIKAEEELIKESSEALRLQRSQYEEADSKINGFIAKPLPSEPSITPAMLNTDLITTHLMKDGTLAGIIDLQAAGVAKSLCALLNLIVENKNNEEEESDMELDANEQAAALDHEEAQRQMDGGSTSSATPRRRRGKQQVKKDEMDLTQLAAGKRDADAADTEQPPPPKVPTFNIAAGDDPKKGPGEHRGAEGVGKEKTRISKGKLQGKCWEKRKKRKRKNIFQSATTFPK